MAHKKTSKPFDAAKYLASESDIVLYISEALQTNDVEYITHAIGIAAKARGMTQIADN
jgi:probable addiction module antidote protein